MRRTYRIAPELLEGRKLPSFIGIAYPVTPLPEIATACDASDDPPITQPPLPTTGPGGPGSSS